MSFDAPFLLFSVVRRSTVFTTPYSSMSWTTSPYRPPLPVPVGIRPGLRLFDMVTTSVTSSNAFTALRAESGFPFAETVTFVRLYSPPGVISWACRSPTPSGVDAVVPTLRSTVVVIVALVVLRMSFDAPFLLFSVVVLVTRFTTPLSSMS